MISEAGLTGLNIAFNTSGSPIAFNGNPTWGPYVAPTNANVIYAFYGVQDPDATGQYMAWTWLWEVTPSTIPSTGQLLETGVWIAYMRASFKKLLMAALATSLQTITTSH